MEQFRKKIGMVMWLNPDLLSIQNFMLLKIQSGGQLPSGKYKNLYKCVAKPSV